MQGREDPIFQKGGFKTTEDGCYLIIEVLICMLIPSLWISPSPAYGYVDLLFGCLLWPLLAEGRG